MSVIAEFAVPAEEFALGRLLELGPDVRVRLESVVPIGETTIPYVRVQAPDVAEVEEVLESSPVLDGVRNVDAGGEDALFRVEWSGELDGLVAALARSDAVVLDGFGRGGRWSFQVRFPDDSQLSTFYRSLVEANIPIELERIHDPVEGPGQFGLTPEQREALRAAFEEGYFAVPREATLVDLARRLDISDAAVSQRIRRGLVSLLSATVLRETPGQ